MSDFLSAKLLLSVYKKLPAAVLRIDGAVDKTAMQSFYAREENTMAQYNRIIELNSLKADYINIKVLVDKATSLMLRSDKEILFLRYIKGLTFRSISDRLNSSLRQTFRLFDGAVESFAAQLGCLGFDNNQVLERFGHLPLVERELARFKEEGYICV